MDMSPFGALATLHSDILSCRVSGVICKIAESLSGETGHKDLQHYVRLPIAPNQLGSGDAWCPFILMDRVFLRVRGPSDYYRPVCMALRRKASQSSSQPHCVGLRLVEEIRH